VKDHRFVDPLAAPGEADLTAHVDFEALAGAAAAAGLTASVALPQRDFLLRLGLAERAETLALANPATFEAIRTAAERLVDPAPTGMGALFKAMVVHSPDLLPPAVQPPG
jgi:NADH dehydrogenase [ubiquinone] 1 alpha subcomplex assembly factor 7